MVKIGGEKGTTAPSPRKPDKGESRGLTGSSSAPLNTLPPTAGHDWKTNENPKKPVENEGMRAHLAS